MKHEVTTLNTKKSLSSSLKNLWIKSLCQKSQ